MTEIRGGYVSRTLPVTLGAVFPECFSLYVGADGNVEVEYEDGTTDVLPGLKGGMFYPLRIVRVVSSANTTVTAANLRRGY